MESTNNKVPTADQTVKGVMDKINQGAVKMHSRPFFLAQTFAWVAAAILILLLSLLSASFLIFSLKATGKIFLPEFGGRGWGALLATFPWLILAVVFALIVVLEFLVRHFAYKRPLLYLAGIILFVIVIGSFLIDGSPFHSTLFEQAEQNKLPGIGRVYLYYGKDKDSILRMGVVGSLTPNGFILKEDEGPIPIIFSNESQKAGLSNGDWVYVFGSEQDGTLQAIGIKRVTHEPFFEKFFDFDLK